MTFLGIGIFLLFLFDLFVFVREMSVAIIHRLNFFADRPEKMAKLPVILGNLDVTIDNVAPDITSEFVTIKAPSVFLYTAIRRKYKSLKTHTKILKI